MAFTKKLRVQVDGGGESLSAEKAYSGGTRASLDEAIPAEQTDLELEFAMALTGLQMLVISATCAMTLKTNSSGDPDDTLSLVADSPYVWTADSLDACLITAAITSLFVSTAAGVSGTLKIEAIADATP